ncbi:MAG: 30S ribosomal protein S18 [Bacilli bacterium]
MPRKGRGGKRKRVCQFCVDKIVVVDYKESSRLSKYLTERGKILPRRISGNCARHQRQVTVAVKRSRQVALLPYSME